MASISSTSSLGNTSLRGFGGMASGIDRDAIIEQMTLGTTTKINNQEKAITKLEWKQEAFRGISDKILDMHDNYFSYTSSNSLKDPNTFAKSLISVHGKEDSTKFVTATGSSDLVNNVSIQAVRQIATSSVYKSDERTGGSLVTKLTGEDGTLMQYPVLYSGTQLRFKHTTDDSIATSVFTLPSTYKERDADGNIVKNEKGEEITKSIDFFIGTDEDGNITETEEEYGKRLEKELNYALLDSETKIGDNKIGECIQFKYDTATKKMTITDQGQNLKNENLKGLGAYGIQANSTALNGLGYNGSKDGVLSVSDYNDKLNTFQDSAIQQTSRLEYLAGQKVTFNYDGNKKDIELITRDELKELQDISSDEDRIKKIAENLQKRLDRAYGTGMVKADVTDDGKLSFTTAGKSSTVSIASNDGITLYALGITSGESNKINLEGKLNQTNLGIDLNKTDADGKKVYEDGLVINGVKIDGINANTSISTILSKINSNENVGVKATYVDATGQFMLVSKETGAAREINLDSQLAKDLFGGTADKNGGLVKGQDAVIDVSYGNGVTVTMERASNSFNLEGLNVTISGAFGGDWEDDGQTMTKEEAEKYELQEGERLVDGKNGDKILQTWKADSSEAVTFSAKADVDKVVEKVKKFFEEFNAIATEVNTQVTTRPDSSYGPLTDEQKEEMSETSIENWEKKAKSGLLFGDGTMRDLSMDIQSIYSRLMQQTGLSYEDLKEMGISYSDNEKDGGVLVFDEAKFRDAMESKPEKISDFFTGGNGMGQGFTKLVEDTFTPYATRYATRNGNSYGRLIEEAGSEKIPTSIMKNQIYSEIKSKQDLIEQLRAKLVTEQDRYIAQFTTMETMINQMNSQSSWLSQITG